MCKYFITPIFGLKRNETERKKSQIKKYNFIDMNLEIVHISGIKKHFKKQSCDFFFDSLKNEYGTSENEVLFLKCVYTNNIIEIFHKFLKLEVHLNCIYPKDKIFIFKNLFFLMEDNKITKLALLFYEGNKTPPELSSNYLDKNPILNKSMLDKHVGRAMQFFSYSKIINNDLQMRIIFLVIAFESLLGSNNSNTGKISKKICFLISTGETEQNVFIERGCEIIEKVEKLFKYRHDIVHKGSIEEHEDFSNLSSEDRGEKQTKFLIELRNIFYILIMEYIHLCDTEKLNNEQIKKFVGFLVTGCSKEKALRKVKKNKKKK